MQRIASLFLTILLVVQTFIPGVAAENTSEKTNTSNETIFTLGNINIEDGEANVTFLWSLEHFDVKNIEGYSESINLPNETTLKSGEVVNLYYETIPHKDVVFKDEIIGLYKIDSDNVLTITFNDKSAILVDEKLNGEINVNAKVEVVKVDEGESHKKADEIGRNEEKLVKQIEKAINKAKKSKDEKDILIGLELINQLENDELKGKFEQALKNISQSKNKVTATESKNNNNSNNLNSESGKVENPITISLGHLEDLAGNKYGTDYPLGKNDEFRLHIDWSLVDNHGWKKDEQYTFDLPSQIYLHGEIKGEELRDSNGDLIAYYDISIDKKLTLTFTDFIENNSNISGWLEIIAKLDQSEAEEEDGKVVIGDFEEEGNLEIPLNKTDLGKTIDKEGVPNKGYSPDEITWTVTVNKEQLPLENAVITDKLPEGLEYKPGSLKVTKEKVKLDGETVVESEELTIDPTISENELSINLDNINERYTIEYTTTITEAGESVEKFINNVTITDNELTPESAKADVEVKRGAPIKKASVTEFNPISQRIKWEIEFNFNEKEVNLTDTPLYDKWSIDQDMILVSDSIKFIEVEIDDEGNATNVGEEKTPQSLGGTVTEITHDEGKGFEITGFTTNKPYRIIYETEVQGQVLEELILKNVAGFGPHEEVGEGPGKIGLYYGVKEANDVNYKDKTIDWTITLNQDKYLMKDIEIVDTLGPGLTFKKDSVKITVAGAEYNDAIITNNENGTFTVQFPEDFETEEIIKITYKTDYDADQVELIDGIKKPKNMMQVTWTPDYQEDPITKQVTAQTELNQYATDSVWKNGTYNPNTQEITWELHINYRENFYENLMIKDTPQENQQFVDGSVTVEKVTIAKDGKMTYEETDDFINAITEENNGFTLTIGETSDAYRITYKTSIENLEKVHDEYTNKLDVFDGENNIIFEKTAKVGVIKTSKFGSKTGKQDGKKIKWSIDVNMAQQVIKNLQLIDEPSNPELMEYIDGTIKVYKVTEFDQDGKPSEKDEYTDFVESVEEDKLTIKWGENKAVNNAFIVEYETLYFAGHNAEIENKYKITGDSIGEDESDSSGSDTVTISQLTSGGGQGTAGYLQVKKVDTTYDFDERKNPSLEEAAGLAGAEFELYDVETGALLKTATSDEDGIANFGRLLFGFYEIREVSAPENYIIEKEKAVVKIDKKYVKDDPETYEVVTLGNYKPVYAVELNKVDSVSEEPIEGAEFTITGPNNYSNTKTSGENGYILFDGLPSAGEYTIKETKPAQFYQNNTDEHKVNIGVDNKAPKQLGDVKNTLVPGKGQLRKVDHLKTNGNTGDYVGLKDAIFGIYMTKNDAENNINSKGTFGTNEDGIGETPELSPGKYVIKEINPPQGFESSNTLYYLDIPEANEVNTYNISKTENETPNDVINIENTVKRTNLEITKVDAENDKQLIKDVVFKITGYDGEDYNGRYDGIGNSLIDTTATTNSSGIATFKNLPPGTYTIVEFGVPSDYGFIPSTKPLEVKVGYGDVHSTGAITTTWPNKPLAKVTLKKVDSESAYPLEGVEFSLWKGNEEITNHYNHNFTTNSNGEIVITGLTPGDYELREKEAPKGYTKGQKSTRSFTVPELSQLTNPNETETIQFVDLADQEDGAVVNDIVKGSIKLKKVDGDTGASLQGVQFKIEAIFLENQGSINLNEYNSNSEFTQTTNVDGEVEFTDLRPGTYKVWESQPLDGYQPYWKDIGTVEVNLQNEPHNVTLKDIVNYKKRTLTVTKKWDDLDENLRPDEVTVELVRKVENGQFTSLNPQVTETIKKSDEWKLEFKNLDAVNSNGEEYIYSIREVTPEGYASQVSETVIDDNNKEKQSVELTNTANVTKIELTKKDLISGELIKGAKFELTNPKGVKTEATTEDGKVTFENLQPGTYTLKEITAAPGYILNTEEKTITITNKDVDDKVVKEVAFENSPLAKVTILKQDIDTGTPLAGAVFKITGDNDFEKTVTTGDNGQIVVTGLPAGDYTIEEVIPPSGYSKHGNDNDKRTFTVKSDETTTIEHNFTSNDGELNEGAFRNNIITGSVQLTKQDDNNDPMENVEFTLIATELDFAAQDYVDEYNKESLQNQYQTDSDGKLEITNLRPGKYVLTETIPDGYQDDYVGHEKGLGDHKGEFEFTIEPAKENEDTATELNLGTITNYALTEIEVSKVWQDGNVADRNVTNQKIHLQRKVEGGTAETVESVDLEAENKIYTFKNLPVVDEEGKEYKYFVKEDEVPGYETHIVDFVITNTRSENITISGEKTWEYGKDGEQYTPDEIIVKLMKNNGEDKVATQTVVADDNGEWTYEFTNLPLFDDRGVEIDYSITEEKVPGFNFKVDGYNITNTQETINISGTKTWQDEENTASRPDDITVQVLIEGTTEVIAEQRLTDISGATQSYTFENLPKYDKDGNEITYVINELRVPGYDAKIVGYDITNTRTDKANISVTKEWLDEDENDRPDSITVQLFQNGEEYKEVTIEQKDNWSYTFENLDQFDEKGHPYEYTVEEVNVDEKYEVQESQWIAANNGFTITNIRTGTTTIEGTKTWLDGNSPDRPDFIEIKINRFTEGGQKEVETRKIAAQDSNEWTYHFVYPAFNEEGKAYTYEVEEIVPDGYELKEKDGFNFTNVRVGTTEVVGEKMWNLGVGGSTYKPENITIHLMKNEGEELIDSQTVEAPWTFQFVDLPKYDENGVEIDYSIVEDDIIGFTARYDRFNITNTQETIEIPLTKVWDEVDLSDRPESITVEVKNEREVVDTVKLTGEQTETEWYYTFENLPKYDANGEEIVYNIEEVSVENYHTKVQKIDEGFVITNKQKTYAIGDYVWVDRNKDGIQDDNEEPLVGVKVELYDEDENIIAETETDENGRYIFDELPAGEYKVKFTLTEEQAEKYRFTKEQAGEDTSVDSDAHPETGWTREIVLNEANEYLTKDYDYQEFLATEGIDPMWDAGVIELVQVAGEKTWVGDDEENRPELITVKLNANGEKVKDQKVTGPEWTFIFAGLDKYDKNGEEIVYTIDEVAVDGYETSIDGYNITNTFVPKDVEKPVDDSKDDTVNGTKKESEKDDVDKGGLLPNTATQIFSFIALGIGLITLGVTVIFTRRRNETL